MSSPPVAIPHLGMIFFILALITFVVGAVVVGISNPDPKFIPIDGFVGFSLLTAGFIF